MANPTSCGTAGDGTDSLACCAASTSAQRIELDPSLKYQAVHDGENVSGAQDNNTIILGTGTSAPAATSAEGVKYKLTPGAEVTIGPRVNHLWYVVAAGAPTFSLSCKELRR